jgi:hypothetical protein
MLGDYTGRFVLPFYLDLARSQRSIADFGCRAETTWQNLIGAEELDSAIETPERIDKELLTK